MEMEWFCHPDEAPTWYEFWCEQRRDWWQGLGLSADNLLLRSHEQDELAHYARDGCGVFDIEYRFPFTAPGFAELEGVAHRGNFDLSRHEEHARHRVPRELFIPSREDVRDKVAVHVRQAEVPSLVVVGQPLVVETE